MTHPERDDPKYQGFIGKMRYYDRPLYTIGTAIAVLITIYLGTRRAVNDIVASTDVIQELRLVNNKQEFLNSQQKIFNDQQAELNMFIKENMSRMGRQLDELTRRK